MPIATARARPGAAPAAAALVAVGVLLGACDRITAVLEEKAQEVAEEIVPPDEAAPPAGPVLTDEEQLAAKLALYTECQGRASRRMRQSFQRYQEHVQADGTPRRDKDGKPKKPFVHPIDSELGPCEEALAKGPGMPPPLPELEAAMAAWLPAAKAFAATTQALDAYYDEAGYETDGWAKGKELAPGLLAEHEAWAAADEALAQAIEARQEVVERALLDQVQARRGKDLEWHARSVVLHAKAFVRCFAPPLPPGATAEPARSKPAARGAEPACASELAALVEAESGFRDHYEAHRAQADDIFWMSAFEASVTDLVTAAKAAAAPGKPGAKGQAAERLAKLRDAQADLVADANNLRFDR